MDCVYYETDAFIVKTTDEMKFSLMIGTKIPLVIGWVFTVPML